MNRRKILVKRGYRVPDEYVELGENEKLCDTCSGTGKISVCHVYYGTDEPCFKCGGRGKLTKSQCDFWSRISPREGENNEQAKVS